MSSIRRYLTVSLLLGIGIAVLLTAGVTFVIARDGLVSEFDGALMDKVRGLGALLEDDEDGLEFEFPEGLMPEFVAEERPNYFQIWREDGRIVARSRSLGDRELPLRAGPLDAPATWDLVLPDGRAGRAAGVRLVVDRGDGAADAASGAPAPGSAAAPGAVSGAPRPRVALVVARGRGELDGALQRLAAGMVLAVVASCLAVVGIVALTVRRGLRPLVRLAGEVDGIDAGRLSGRVSPPGPRELRPLAAKLNDLLARLERAFRRERRMTSGVAHELRTPIAEIRSAADVARRWPADQTMQRDAVETAHEVAVQMGHVVEALLRLSRVEAGAAALEPAPVDLSALVEQAFAARRERAAAEGLELRTTGPSGITVRADAGLLELVVRNLADNAVSHTPKGGSVTSRLEVVGSSAVWTVVNGPVDLEEEDLARLPEPLWRKDAARSSRDHAGLGLTLAQSVARALGVTLELALEDGALRVTLRVPGAAPAPVGERQAIRS